MRWIVVFVHVHSAELDVIRLRPDHFNDGGDAARIKKEICVCVWRRGGVQNHSHFSEGHSGGSREWNWESFLFFFCLSLFFFYRAIKEPWTHIDKLPPTELVSCSALASREVK